MLDVKGFLDSPLHAIHETCKSSQLIIVNVFKDKMSSYLRFWYKLNTRGIVKSCVLCFLRDYYGDSPDVVFPSFLFISYRLPWCFRMFPLVFLRFPRVFLLFPIGASPFPILDFAETYKKQLGKVKYYLLFIIIYYLLFLYLFSGKKLIYSKI